MNKSIQDLILKIFVVGNVLLFINTKNVYNLYLIFFALIVALSGSWAESLNKFIEKFVQKIGYTLLKLVLVVIYVCYFIPMKILTRNKKTEHHSSFEKVTRSKIHYERLW